MRAVTVAKTSGKSVGEQWKVSGHASSRRHNEARPADADYEYTSEEQHSMIQMNFSSKNIYL